MTSRCTLTPLTCLENLSRVLKRCIDTNLMLNFEKCHFMVTEGIVLGHLVSNREIEVNKAKIDVITSIPNLASVRDIVLSLSKLLQKDVDFVFDEACAPNWEFPFELMCYASNSTLGAVLGQRVRISKPAHVIAYASQTMDPT
ncbi:hypothetical protein CR513_06535, partial [Mucuna pruriens]